MADPRASPSPAADQAFTIGVSAAAIGAVAVVGFLIWIGMVTPFFAVVTLVLLFPAYLLIVASVLSKWLGFDKDISDLQRVTRSDEPVDEWLDR